MKIDPSIFKAYDIRGIYPDQLDEQKAYAITRAFATLLKKENPDKPLSVVVGMDMRLSSPSIKREVVRGLTDTGVNVVDIGLASTPTYYFAVGYYDYDAGVQISASHNPKEYNGLKLVRRGAVAMGAATGGAELARAVMEDDYAPMTGEKGTVEVKEGITEQAITEYLKIAEPVDIKPFKIVVDTANAMGILDYGELFNHIPGAIIKMNFELDGTFPAHEADPLKEENVKDLRERVVAEQADLGIAADGDSDRIFIIDEKGDIVPSTVLYTILARIERQQEPSATYAYEIRLGRLVEDEFRGTPAKLVQTPVGHTLIKKIMRDNNALFGGEISGHYFFRMPFGTFEAPALLVLKLLAYLSQQDKPLSEIVMPYKRYVSSGEVNTRMESRALIEQKIAQIKEQYSDGTQVFIDGIKVDYPDYWFSIRASNTEPLIRLVVEASTKQVMEQKRDKLLAFIRS